MHGETLKINIGECSDSDSSNSCTVKD